MKNIEEKLMNLKKEEIINILNSIYSIAGGKEINLESLSSNIRGIVKPYIKANEEKRLDLIDELNEALEGMEVDDDIKSLAHDISEYISNIYYSNPLKKFNEDNLEDRLYDLDDMSEKSDETLETKLIESLQNQDDALNIIDIPAIIVGLVKTYESLTPTRKLDFLEILNEHYDKKYAQDIDIISAQIKKQEITGILSKVNTLSANGQRKFYETAYDEIVELYGSIAKEERIKRCDHEFGKWKDCSYTDYIRTRIDLQMCDNVPVRKIVYARKCKKCGFEDIVRDEVPNEVRVEREKKAKEKEIKTLEKRLKQLKEDN